MKKIDILNWCIGIALVLAVLFSGCSSLESMFMGSVSKEASRDAGKTVEKEAAPETESAQARTSSTGPQWNQLMITQAQMAFNYAFSAGGMWAGQANYNPGEFTKFEWMMKGNDSIIIERAYLMELDDGKQWWRVSWDDSEGLWIWEALIDPESSEMLRMRARDPDGNEGEVPVSGQAVYMPATELTRESVKGASVGQEKVDVPAGRFQADHVVFMAGGGGGQVEFWLAPQIPGGVVKYLISQSGEGILWNSDLIEYGKKATTILSSF